MKNFDDWNLDEAAKTVVEDIVTLKFSFIGTWTKISCKMEKERGEISFEHGTVFASKWYNDRRKIFDEIRESTVFMSEILNMDPDKATWHTEVTARGKDRWSRCNGVRFQKDPQHITKEMKDSFWKGTEYGGSAGPIVKKMVAAYKEATNKSWSKWDGIMFQFQGTPENLLLMVKKFKVALQNEFKVMNTSRKFGLS